MKVKCDNQYLETLNTWFYYPRSNWADGTVYQSLLSNVYVYSYDYLVDQIVMELNLKSNVVMKYGLVKYRKQQTINS